MPLKFFDPHPFNSNSRDAHLRFFQEAETLFRLRHPNIIAIYGVGTHSDGRPYILMEEFVGKNLNQLKESGGVDPASALGYVEMFADALRHAHGARIVHRDITPRNLMVSVDSHGNWDARVLDFGIAAALDPEGVRLTRTGGTCVGDAYSAPELVQNPRLRDSGCDVYSLGACWLWILTGSTGKGLGWEESLKASVSPAYARAIRCCLKPPEERCSMDELLMNVRALRSGNSPAAGLDELHEHDILTLSRIASEGQALRADVSENTVGVSRVASAIAVMRLIRSGFITENSMYLRVEDDGLEWLAEHLDHVEALEERVRAPVF